MMFLGVLSTKDHLERGVKKGLTGSSTLPYDGMRALAVGNLLLLE